MFLLPEHSISTLNVIHNMDALSLLRGLAAGSVDAIIADPPYAVTKNAWDKPQNWTALFREFRRVITPRGAIAVFCNNRLFAKLVTENDDIFRYEIVIEKSNPSGFLNANRMPLMCHEFVAIFGHTLPNYYPQMKSGAAHSRNRDKGETANYGKHNPLGKTYHHTLYYPRSVWRTVKPPEASITLTHIPHRESLHPTQKDVSLIEQLVLTYTRPGALVVDPFSGSGTTAVAARNTGRHYICGDITREYVTQSRLRLRNSDPFQHKQVTPDVKQLSLFADVIG